MVGRKIQLPSYQAWANGLPRGGFVYLHNGGEYTTSEIDLAKAHLMRRKDRTVCGFLKNGASCNFNHDGKKTNVDLVRHELTHCSGGYRCIACSAPPFKQKSHLKTHVDTVHGVEDVFKCLACPKGFKDQALASRHEKQHRGEKVDGKTHTWYRVDGQRRRLSPRKTAATIHQAGPSAPQHIEQQPLPPFGYPPLQQEPTAVFDGNPQGYNPFLDPDLASRQDEQWNPVMHDTLPPMTYPPLDSLPPTSYLLPESNKPRNPPIEDRPSMGNPPPMVNMTPSGYPLLEGYNPLAGPSEPGPVDEEAPQIPADLENNPFNPLVSPFQFDLEWPAPEPVYAFDYQIPEPEAPTWDHPAPEPEASRSEYPPPGWESRLKVFT